MNSICLEHIGINPPGTGEQSNGLSLGVLEFLPALYPKERQSPGLQDDGTIRNWPRVIHYPSLQGILPPLPRLCHDFLHLSCRGMEHLFTHLKCRMIGDHLPPALPPFPVRTESILMFNFYALRSGCSGGGRLGEGHVIVMTGIWDESQNHKHIFIMTLLLPGLSSGESQSPGQMVINFHNSFHRRMQWYLPKANRYFPSILPSTFPAYSQPLPAPRWRYKVDRIPGLKTPSWDLSVQKATGADGDSSQLASCPYTLPYSPRAWLRVNQAGVGEFPASTGRLRPNNRLVDSGGTTWLQKYNCLCLVPSRAPFAL